MRFGDVLFHHTGYRDPALLQRDQPLVKLELAEQPEHPFTLFNLGSTHQEQCRHAEALDALEHSLCWSHPSDSILRELYGLIAGCQRHWDHCRTPWPPAGKAAGTILTTRNCSFAKESCAASRAT
jgi:hypothetical protein